MVGIRAHRNLRPRRPLCPWAPCSLCCGAVQTAEEKAKKRAMDEARKKAARRKKKLEELERKKEAEALEAARQAHIRLEKEAAENSPWGERLECALEFHGFVSQEGARAPRALTALFDDEGLLGDDMRADGQTIPEQAEGEEGYVPPDDGGVLQGTVRGEFLTATRAGHPVLTAVTGYPECRSRRTVRDGERAVFRLRVERKATGAPWGFGVALCGELPLGHSWEEDEESAGRVLHLNTFHNNVKNGPEIVYDRAPGDAVAVDRRDLADGAGAFFGARGFGPAGPFAFNWPDKDGFGPVQEGDVIEVAVDLTDAVPPPPPPLGDGGGSGSGSEGDEGEDADGGASGARRPTDDGETFAWQEGPGSIAFSINDRPLPVAVRGVKARVAARAPLRAGTAGAADAADAADSPALSRGGSAWSEAHQPAAASERVSRPLSARAPAPAPAWALCLAVQVRPTPQTRARGARPRPRGGQAPGARPLERVT